MSISLQPITFDTVRSINRLSVREDQKRFVALNSESLAQALFCPEAWYRAIYSEEVPIGFVMLHDPSLTSDVRPAKVFVWRFMIDERFQGRGFGEAALRLVIEHVRSKAVTSELYLSHVEDPASAGPFYRKLGFEYTGEIDEGELIMKLAL
jgi:diamine N-acetyltransferase